MSDERRGGRPPGVSPDVDEDGLTFRERDVLALKQEDPEISQTRIGQRLGITRQQVHQIVVRLKEKKLWPKK